MPPRTRCRKLQEHAMYQEPAPRRSAREPGGLVASHAVRASAFHLWTPASAQAVFE